MRSTTLTLFGLALLACACQSDNGGQSGDFSGQDDGGETSGDGCEDTETPIDAADDTMLGFSASDVSSFIGQGFSAPLSWKALSNVSYGPESGTSELTLSVTPTGEAWYVTSAPAQDGEEGGLAIDIGCPPPRLRLAVDVQLDTQGGALAESFSTTVDAASPRFASLDYRLALDAIAGSFAIESLTPPEAKVEALSLNATLSPAGMTGNLSGLIEVNDGNVSSAGNLLFATWPESATCPADQSGVSGIPVGIDGAALGLSGADALERYNAATPVNVTWHDGSTSQLTLTATAAGDGCVRPNPYVYSAYDVEATVVFPVALDALSEDGKLAGSYEATLSIWPEGDDHHVSVEVSLPLELEQLAESGLSGVTLPQGLHRLFYILNSEVEAGAAHGLLRLNGLTDPPCVTEPQQPDPGGMSAPGCEGTHVDELESAIWGHGTVD